MTSDRFYLAALLGTLFAAAVAVCFSIEGGSYRAAILVPSAIFICIIAIMLAARSNPSLLRVMMAALVVKLFATWVYTALPAFQQSDAMGVYFDNAVQYSGSLANFSHLFSWQQIWGTNLVIAIGACLFTVTGPSLVAAMVVFSLIGFWGQFIFYRAFVIAFPMANKHAAALTLFFFPSVVYWTSMFGKDALTLLAIGLIAYGVARKFDGRGWSTILVGLALATLVRPHVGAFASISLFASYLFAKVPNQRRIVGLKFLLFPLFFVTCFGVLTYSQNSLGINNMVDAETMSENSYKNNQVGGSAFGEDETTQERLVQSPLLLFRPFPWEINSWTAVLASCEGLGLLLFILWRRTAILRLLRHSRSYPLTVFAVSLFIIFSTVFSMSISNFGLLARQRVLVLPLVLTLIVASSSFGRKRSVGLDRSLAVGVAR